MRTLQYVVILLGFFEILTNLFHLCHGTIEKIGLSAKRQHQELPGHLVAREYFFKAIVMFGFGLAFAVLGILSLWMENLAWLLLSGPLVLFGVYGIVQAIVYRAELKVWPAMLVYNLPAAALFFLNQG